jgi:hypothetical protein
MRRNYHRNLSASIYHHAKNVNGIIGILAYPKIKSKRKRGIRPDEGARKKKAKIA